MIAGQEVDMEGSGDHEWKGGCQELEGSRGSRRGGSEEEVTERLMETEWGCWEVRAHCSPFHPYDPSDPECRPHPGVRQSTKTEVRDGAWVERTKLP